MNPVFKQVSISLFCSLFITSYLLISTNTCLATGRDAAVKDAAVKKATQAESRIAVAQTAWQIIKLTGFTRARHTLPLATEVAGKVLRVFVDIGDKIADQGQVACLDQTFIKLEVKANQAELKRLAAEVNYFQKQVERHRQLVNQQNSSQMNLDGVERNLAGMQAQIEAQKVESRRLTETQRRHCISAPVGWLLTERLVEPGQWLGIGDPLGSVGDFTRLLVPFALSMQEYQALQQASKPLQLLLTDLGVTVPAQLVRVSPAFDEQTRKIMLDLEISSGLEQYRGGLRAELSLQLPLQDGSVLISEKALQQRYEDYWLQREAGDEVRVIYQGRSGLKTTEGAALIRITSADIQVGDRFLIDTQRD